MEENIKVPQKPALLKNNRVLLCFGYWHDYATIVPLDHFRVEKMQRRVVFQHLIPHSSEVYNLRIIIIQDYILHFTFCCTFCCRRSKYGESVVFGATRYTLFDVGATAKILQLVREIAHILLLSLFTFQLLFESRFCRVCITIQHRLGQLS
jgi:hypothetical protein